MNKIKVTMTNHSLHYSDRYLSRNAVITSSKKINNIESNVADMLLDYENYTLKPLESCLKYGHDSVLEHVSYTFVIDGASRSLLAQIIRHRLFSFTSGSQHYINYSEIGGFEVPVEILNKSIEFQTKYQDTLANCMENYKKLIEMGLDHSVARQVLPNAMRNNLVMTGNLREWKNFLAQRLCGRNTSEIEYIAYLIYKELEKYNPLVMKYTGPACKVFGKCNQGDKSCGQIYSEEKYKEKFKLLLEE